MSKECILKGCFEVFLGFIIILQNYVDTKLDKIEMLMTSKDPKNII